jgi:hypothetical protein
MDQSAAPSHQEIAARAHQLWLAEGEPANSAERHWLEAERELQAAVKSRSLLEKVKQRSGSVQP